MGRNHSRILTSRKPCFFIPWLALFRILFRDSLLLKHNKMIRGYLFAALFIIVLMIPINGAAKSVYQSGYGKKAGCEQDLSARIRCDLLNVLIATEYEAPFFKANKRRVIPAVILFIEQIEYRDDRNSAIAPSWVINLIYLLIGFFSGYLIRHWRSLYKHKKARERWEADR